MEVKGFNCFMIILVMMALCVASRIVVAKQLSQLNKTPIKSIQSKDGDIIDCVHISHQPAFDHPLMKGHTIQMRPNYHPKGLFGDRKHADEDDTRKPITQLWQVDGRCPEGTIPIKRTKEEDVRRASSIKSFGKKNLSQRRLYARELNTTDPYESVAAFVTGDVYYGAEAVLNVWGPQVEEPSEYSSSQIWITGGSFDSDDHNAMVAGWHVLPQLYGDNNTRLFSYWTVDNFNVTGCYNLLCSGFVQTNNEVSLGATITPLSTYLGAQFVATFLVWKDPTQGAWWLKIGNDIIGYWPSTLFTHLATSASAIEWGGQVLNSKPNGMHTTTQMGSGHFPEEGLGRASYMRSFLVVDGSNILVPPTNISALATHPYCYNVTLGRADDWGDYVFYGGPGRNPNCP